MSTTERMQAITLLRRALPDGVRVELLDDSETGQELRLQYGELSPIRLVLTARAEDNGERSDALLVRVLRGSPEERDRLRGEHESFIDLEGAVYLAAPGFYLDRSDLSPPPVSSPAQGTDPYADAASQIVRVLLEAPQGRRLSIRGLAAEAEVHPSTASRVTSELERRELVRDDRPGERRQSSIWVPDPEALIEDWARAYAWRDNRQLRLAAPIGSPRRFIERMPEVMGGLRWALTLQAGASRISPHARLETVHAYVESERPLEELAIRLGWEPSPSGALCLLRPKYTESVWFREREREGIPVVGPAQLVVDLWHYPVRGREAARHLIETVLRPKWRSADHGR